MCRWDDRAAGKPVHVVASAHSADANCISFSPHEASLLLTGSTDKVCIVCMYACLCVYVILLVHTMHPCC